MLDERWPELSLKTWNKMTVRELKNILKVNKINSKSDTGDEALYSALEFKSSIDVIRILIEGGADVNVKNRGEGTTPLMAAVLYNPDLKVIQLLIDSGSDLDANDDDGKTALTHALWNNVASDVVNLLKKTLCECNE